MKPEDVKFPIPRKILTDTIEALFELRTRYEIEACSLARLYGMPPEDLAVDRVDKAGAVACLSAYYKELLKNCE